jgi:ligand-binding sensor domain-containing protein/signal transduction histidine kinase
MIHFLKKYRRLLPIIWLVAVTFLNSVAQPKQLQFRFLSTDKGLSSSMVLSVLQDHNGFMWIGTYDGLNRYDGHDFMVFKSGGNDPGSLPCDQIRDIYQDSENNLFIGTNCGLSMYDPDNDNFINFMSLESSPLNGTDCTVYNITSDSLGTLWLSTNIGLVFFDRKHNISKTFSNDPNNPESLSNNWVECNYIDSKGRHWVSTRTGLNLFLPDKGTFKHILSGVKADENYSKNSFLEIHEDKEGNIWIGSYNGLFCIENTSNDETLTWYGPNPKNPNSISGNRLISLFVDSEDNLWVGAENDGLFLFNRYEKNFWHYLPDEYDPTSLNNISVQAITMDRTENLWIGTYGGGINISPKNSEGIQQFKNLKGGERSLSNNVVSAFHEDYKGQIWIGTDGGGLNLFDEKTKRFTRFNKNNSGFSSNVILSIIEDSKNNLWMGTWGGGIIKYNPGTKKVDTYTTKNSKIQDDNIFCIESGDNNDLWLASYRNGLIHYKINTDEFISYTTDNSNLGNNYVYIIKKDGKGRLILGTTNGLKTFLPNKEDFINYTHNPNNPNSISHGIVYDILIKNDTTVWVATQSGLNRFNPETGIFYRYFKKDGLPNDVIKGLVFDNTGTLWVTTNGGIGRFDYKNKQYDFFTEEDGLQSNEFDFKSTLLSSSGQLFLGGVNGFNIINPEKITKNHKVPKIVLTNLEILNKPVVPNTPGSPLKTNIAEVKEIRLRHDQSVVTLYFSAMDFTRPEKNQYAYKLENFDADWIHSGKKHEVTYTNLDPGDYIFRVKGSNNDGIWNEEGISLKITILPPWFKTTVALIIFVLSVTLIIILIFYRRTASLRKQKELLLKKVEERTNDLNEKNVLLEKQSDNLIKTNTLLEIRQETIKSQSEELKVIAENLEETNKELTQINATKDKLFSIIAHDLKNPFNVILGYSDLLLNNYYNWDDGQKLEILSYLKESSGNAYSLLENLLNWSRSERGTLEFYPVSLSGSEIVEMATKDVISFARKKGVEIIYEGSENTTQVYADMNMLLLICRNLLMNAIKFSIPGGSITINITDYDQKFVCFSIRDKGIGMDNEKVAMLFKFEKNSSSPGTSGEKGTGLGLILCHDFVLKQGGKIWVESKINMGTTFHFTIPKSGIAG